MDFFGKNDNELKALVKQEVKIAVKEEIKNTNEELERLYKIVEKLAEAIRK